MGFIKRRVVRGPVAENWTERYRPKRLSEVLGNPQAVQALRAWGEAWRTGVPPKRGVLLHGPPGSGKTSAALALAAEFGWGVVELNASDVRSGPAIRRIAGSGAVHETFSDTGEYFASAKGKRKLILLDEADNLYERGGEGATVGDESFSDRGGRRAILDTIAATQQPIVLAANDAYALTRGSGAAFAKHVLHVPFRALAAPTIQKMLARVAQGEGLQVDEATVRDVAASAHGDARSALNDLQAIAQGLPRVPREAVEVLGERNRAETMFRALATIFKGTDGRAARDAVHAVDEPPDFVLAWVDENAPREYRDPRDLAQAYEWLSRADVFLGRVQRRQSFGLWGTATDLITMGVASAKSRAYATPPQYQFPTWIRRMASSRGDRQTRDAVASKVATLFHVGHRVARTEFLPFFASLLPRVPNLAEELCLRLGLDEDEIRFVLGREAGEGLVAQIVGHVEARRGQPAAQREVGDEPPPTEPAPRPAPGKTLMDF